MRKQYEHAVGRSRSVGATATRASTRATPRTTTRDRDRDANVDARATTRRSVANRESRIARASRESRARRARRLDSTPPRHAPARRARIRRRVGEATRGAGEGSRGVVEGSRAASASREANARRAGPGDDGRARGRSCGCTFPRVVTRRVRDSDPPGCGADSARIRGRRRWRCDGWSPCRSSAKRARARVKRRRAR